MKGSGGRLIQEGTVDITLAPAGEGSGEIVAPAPTVTFPIAFDQVPDVMVSPPLGATRTAIDAIYLANYAGITKTGFTVELSVAETVAAFLGNTFTLQWVAVEPL